MMHADSGNLSDWCSFSRSTTLQAAPSLPEVVLTVVWSENHRKSKILPVVDLFRDFQDTQEGTRPLWKSIKPMQLFTLYNFASSTVASRSGPGSDVEGKPLKIQDFAYSGPFPRFPGHPERYSPTLEIYQTDVTLHALQLCKQDQHSPEWPSRSFSAKTDETFIFRLVPSRILWDYLSFDRKERHIWNQHKKLSWSK